MKLPGISVPLPSPYQSTVSIAPIADAEGNTVEVMVRVMNHRAGKGRLVDLEYAEAEARAVIAAVEQFRAQQPKEGATQ